PRVKNTPYKLKLASSRALLNLVEIINVIDASDLSSVQNKNQIDRHDVADCVFETTKPVAFDLSGEHENTSRFVIVDDYEIAGGGSITECIRSEESILKDHITRREVSWEKGLVSAADRETRFGHKPKFIVFTGDENGRSIAKLLEKRLFLSNYTAYYLSMTSFEIGLDSDTLISSEHREIQIHRLGELARILTESGQIFITALGDVDDYDIETLQMLNFPHEILVVNTGKSRFGKFRADIDLETDETGDSAVDAVFDFLRRENILPEYSI
ncbi:MAG: elongation factor 1-alpha C-terminal domain-related protein, partial [Candidatus Latescibacterota bacterium]